MSLSRRYAKALLEISEKAEAIEKTANSLEEFETLHRANQEFREIIKSPMFSRSKRRGILEEILKSSKAPEHLQIFLLFLFDRDRLEIIPAFSRMFRQLADQKSGVLRGELVSAIPLKKEEITKFQNALSKATGRDVTLTTREDPTLIGGLLARVGDVVFDGSVRTQLRQIKDSLLREG